jgi:hypothetical protein
MASAKTTEVKLGADDSAKSVILREIPIPPSKSPPQQFSLRNSQAFLIKLAHLPL